ncbi:MAG: SapC family protein [Magnetococcales bacterium]|nr:SapC family protein [Magnetococcales bacterium]
MNFKLEVLDPVTHQGLFYTPSNSHVNTKNRLTAPLLFSEFVEAARSYPIIFSLSEGDEKLTPMALLGTGDSRGNLFLDAEGNWLENHLIPGSLESYPFYIGPMNDKGTPSVLIDINAPHFQQGTLSPENSFPLFTPSGNPTPFLEGIRKKLLKYQIELGQTDWMVYKLYEQNLFQTKQLSDLISVSNEENAKLSTFFILDPVKLDDLPNDYFLALRQQGMMQSLYALLAAQNNFISLASGLARNGRSAPRKLIPEVQSHNSFLLTNKLEQTDKSTLIIAWFGLAIFSGLLANYLFSSPRSPVAVVQQPVVESRSKPAASPDKQNPSPMNPVQMNEPVAASATTPEHHQDDSIPQAEPEDNDPGLSLPSSEDRPPATLEPVALSPVIATLPNTISSAAPPSDEGSESVSPDVDSTFEQRNPLDDEAMDSMKEDGLIEEVRPAEADNAQLVNTELPTLLPKQRQESDQMTSELPSELNNQPLPPAISQEMNQLIDGVKRNITESRLTLPKGDNAMDKIEQLKKLSPNSSQVDFLLNTVFERFLELAIWDRSGRAKLYLEKAESIYPGDPRISEIERLISE